MKSLLRSFFINTAAIFFAAKVVSGLSYSDRWETLLWAGSSLTLVNLLVKPIIKILTLPINLLTLGIFSWAIDILMLFIVTLIVPGFSIQAFFFPGASLYGFVMPSFYVSIFLSFIFGSIAISFISSFLFWLSR